MKKLLNIGLVALSMVSCNSIIPSNTPQKSFADWFWSYFASSAPKTPEEATRQRERREYWQKSSTLKKVMNPLKESAISGAATATIEIAIGIAIDNIMQHLFNAPRSHLLRDINVLVSVSAGVSVAFLIGLINIYEQLNIYATERNRDIAKQKMKEIISSIIFNSSLYPTRSSKLHVLLKKDEFLNYVDLYIQDLDGILEEVCQELSVQISTADYSEEQRIIDREIDKYIASLKQPIAQLSLAGQIAALKNNAEASTIEHMRGYLSLYDRLQNKLVVETYLKKQGKNFSDPFNLEAIRKMTPYQQEAKKKELEAWKESEKGKAWNEKWQAKLAEEKQDLGKIQREIEREQDEESKKKHQEQFEIVKKNLQKAKAKEAAQ